MGRSLISPTLDQAILEGGRTLTIKRMGPTFRTLVMGVLGLLSGLTMLFGVLVTSGSSGPLANALLKHALPAEDALRQASNAAADEQAALSDASRARGAALATTIEDVVATDARQATFWAMYLGHALGTPQERELRAAYESTALASRRSTSILISLPPSDPRFAAELAAKHRTVSAQIKALDRLVSDTYVPLVRDMASKLLAASAATRTTATVCYLSLAAFFSVIASILLRGARRDQRTLTNEADSLRAAQERAEFDGALQRGLDMMPTEESAIGVVAQASSMVSPDRSVELLVADSSKAHFRQAFSTREDPSVECRVTSPRACPATSSGQTRVFADSSALDACSFLRGRDDPSWAVCVPVNIAGRATGVLHTQGRTGDRVADELVAGLELVARKAGERIGSLRVLARTETQASLDPLTGLPNRRTLENQAHEALKGDTPFVVAFADLDHFKAINDAHGHDAGDRALRLFGRVLRDSIRPRDLLARFGGEEFVLVFPECNLAEGRAVAERIRDNLARALAPGTVPAFTVTIGLAEAHVGDGLTETMAAADAAMLRGKSLGRDRVLASGEPE